MTRVPVTVVIPTWNNVDTLGYTLESVIPQAAEVLVVDDESTDGTDELAERMGADVVTVHGRSAGHARNVGWRKAVHDVVLFTDADAAPAADWCARLSAAFDAPDVDIAGGAIENASRGAFARVFHRMYTKLDARHFHDDSAYLPGMNLAVRKRLYERVRFRDDLPGAQCEDVDFLHRALREGCRIRYVPEAVVRHHQPATLRELAEQEVRHGQGRARFVRMHPELRRPWHTDRAWKWLGLSTLGAPVHLAWALRHGAGLDPAVWAMHLARMVLGDYGFWRGSRLLDGRGGEG